MRSLESRIGRLEKTVTPVADQSRPAPPRAVGKPRGMAIVEHIEYLQTVAKHPETSEHERRQCETAVRRCEQALDGQTRTQIFHEYAEYLRSQLDSDWGDIPRVQQHLRRTLAGCLERLTADSTPTD